MKPLINEPKNKFDKLSIIKKTNWIYYKIV